MRVGIDEHRYHRTRIISFYSAVHCPHIIDTPPARGLNPVVMDLPSHTRDVVC